MEENGEDALRLNNESNQKNETDAISSSLLTAMLGMATDGILVTNDTCRVVAFNDQYLDLWRLPRDILVGVDYRQFASISQVCRDTAKHRQRIAEIHANSPPETLDILELSDGRVFERASQLLHASPSAAGRVWRYRDITARRNAENTLRTEAARLSRLSHDLRTPLNAITGWAKVLRFGFRDESELRRGLDTIERNATLQNQLIDGLLGRKRLLTDRVTLPIVKAFRRRASDGEQRAERPERILPGPDKVDLSGAKVLVVDDDQDALDFTRHVLHQCGAEVYSTVSAVDAVRLVVSARPHLLLSDISMPNVDGYELLRRVRELGRVEGGTIPAIAISGYGRSEDRHRMMKAGFLINVTKPVEPFELIITVANVLELVSR